MAQEYRPNPTYVAPWSRVLILIIALIAICLLSLHFTGSVVPTRPGDILIFENALLLVVLGSAVLEYKFTSPGDAVVNALMGMITLVGVYAVAPSSAWWVVFGFCAVIFVAAAVCTAVSSGPMLTGWPRTISRATYPFAVFFGRARVLFSVMFLFGVFSFYGVQSVPSAELLIFWGIFIAIWPLGLPEFITSLRNTRRRPAPIGRLVRTDSPNIVRVALNPEAIWKPTAIKVYQQVDGTQQHVVPLYAHVHGEQLLGTGLCFPATGDRINGLGSGHLFDLSTMQNLSDEEIAQALGGGTGSWFVGFVIEDSNIEQIRFEACRPCNEGMLVSCQAGGRRIFYQITDGMTREESLEADRHGFQVAIASQLGVLNNERGFSKYTWLPPMNTPVFAQSGTFGKGITTTQEGDFVYGKIPGTQLEVGGAFLEAMEHHTAILGVTGSGKTELAMDMIRHAVAQGIKVVCIDLTARYQGRLVDLHPVNLSIAETLAEELSTKLFDAETGPYGGAAEKRTLKSFSDQLRKQIEATLLSFLTATDDAQRLGIITLEEISNTKAMLHITELYLTCLLHFAKDHPQKCPRILVVVEEAHTVIPEPGTMGLGDYDSRGLVGKIAQIALQGRKYGVGLLVVAQRTATVSKSVLTQCNTMITLSSFDDTSLGFVENFYGRKLAGSIPNLPRLQAVVFGKGIRSERPIIVEIPFDPTKVDIRTVAAGNSTERGDGSPDESRTLPP